MKSTHLDSLHCSFCGKSHEQARKLIAGPNVHICEHCIAALTDLLVDDHPKLTDQLKNDLQVSAKCVFCGKRRAEVWQLLQAQNGNVCSECLQLCHEILADEGMKVVGEDRLSRLREQNRDHDRRRIRRYLRKALDRIRGQQTAAM